MNITRTNVDALNAVITVNVAKADYAEKVEKVLNDYRKNANIPGFRKGAVPMGLIKKQYEKAVIFDEVNKLLQESLNQYLTEEKLEVLGNPLPKVENEINFEAEEMNFDFEIGLAPEFNVDLASVKGITHYKIVADDKLIDEQVERIQKQFGKVSTKDTVEAGDDIQVTFVNEENNINNTVTINVSEIKDKSSNKKFIGKKVGDVIEVSTKKLFEDEHKLMDYLKVDHDLVHGLEINVSATINGISSTEKAELTTELFDRLFGEGNVTSEEDLRGKIKEDAEKQFAQQAEQKFSADVTEYLVANTSFDLPAEFLVRWLQGQGETPLSAEEAQAEYDKSEKGLRYQLIEGRIVTQNEMQVTFEDLKAFTSDLIRQQMAQFGQMNPTEEEVNGIVARVLTNQEEVRRLSEQLMAQKMLELYKSEVPATEKEVSYEAFVKELYGE